MIRWQPLIALEWPQESCEKWQDAERFSSRRARVVKIKRENDGLVPGLWCVLFLHFWGDLCNLCWLGHVTQQSPGVSARWPRFIFSSTRSWGLVDPYSDLRPGRCAQERAECTEGIAHPQPAPCEQKAADLLSQVYYRPVAFQVFFPQTALL